MAQSTSNSTALKAAKQLIELWPHAKPSNPETYMAGLGAVLAGYPLGVVQECVDPRFGLAQKREFPPTIAAVVEWCERKMEFYQSVARYAGRSVALPAPEYSDEHCAQMRQRIAEIPKVYFKAMQQAVK